MPQACFSSAAYVATRLQGILGEEVVQGNEAVETLLRGPIGSFWYAQIDIDGLAQTVLWQPHPASSARPLSSQVCEFRSQPSLLCSWLLLETLRRPSLRYGQGELAHQISVLSRESDRPAGTLSPD